MRLLGAFVFLFASVARADDVVDLDATDPVRVPATSAPKSVPNPWVTDLDDRQRVFGLGTALGGGVAAGALESKPLVVPVLVLPTLEARLFLDRRELVAIEASIPLTANVINSVIVGGIAWATDAFVTLNPGSDDVRFIGGLGVGFSAFDGVAAGEAIRFPAAIGLEAIFAGRNVGLQFCARPWFEVGGTRSTARSNDLFFTVETGTHTMGGVLFLIGFTAYVMKNRSRSPSSSVH